MTAGLWTTETVSDVIGISMDEERIACVIDGQSLTFGDLRRWSRAVAHYLGNAGVQRGDRVVMQLPNSAELVVGILAAWLLGAVPVPVVPLFREHELKTVVARAKPTAIICTEDLRSRNPLAEFASAVRASEVAELRVQLSVSGGSDGWSPFPSSDADGDGVWPGFLDAGACALMLFTSGTTAEPKGVRHNSHSLIAEARSYIRAADLTADDVLFNPAPIAHIGAIVATVLLPWVTGSRVVLTSSRDPGHVSAPVADQRVSFGIGAPVFLAELVSQYEQPDFVGHRVSTFQTGAAPPTGDLLRRANDVGVTVWRAWGMTEAPTMSYGRATDSLSERISTDGRLEPGSEAVAVDDAGSPVAPGVEGELKLSGPKQMLGYVDAASGTDSDGWVYSGDLGTVDASGWVRITGRVNDVINRGGEKFSALEVERAICDIPSIETASVIGAPEERLGEKVVAFVTIRHGARFPGLEALTDHLRSSGIAPQKFPVAVEIVDQMPLTATGKVRKSELVERWVSDNSSA